MSDGNDFEYAQKQFAESYAEVQAAKKRVHIEAIWRKGLAYLLKGIAVFGGVVIAISGKEGTPAHVIGAAITVAIVIDGFLLNHVRLIAVTKADTAYKYLLKDIKVKHEDGLTPILTLKKTDEPKAVKQGIELNGSLKKELNSKSREIEKALDDVNFKALDNLALQHKT